MKATIKTVYHQLGLKELIAIGVGGMIGGGIFSVMGLAVSISGHAAPLAFLLGGIIALIAGYSYIRLALTYRNDGASFTYLEKAFPDHLSISGITGWTVVVGYIGTMALYAFTFGAYGAALFGEANNPLLRQILSIGILLFFLLVNLRGTRMAGGTEDLIVYTKIMLLALLAFAGITAVRTENLVPVFDQGFDSVFMAGALIFVAYEGFQLITNSVIETGNPERNIPRSIYGSILIVIIIYVLLSFIAVGGLSTRALIQAEEYALAIAAEPALGQAGRVITSLAALLATASAINATLFGASRLMAEMATEREIPHAFSFRNTVQVPWLAVITMTGLTLVLTTLGGLELIASFSSMTFLLVSIGITIANYKLRDVTRSRPVLILLGLVLMTATVTTLIIYLWQHSRDTLYTIGLIYLTVIAAEYLLNQRKRRQEPESGAKKQV